MKYFILTCIDFLHRMRLRRYGDRVSLGHGTRLLRKFGVCFLARPEARRYVSIGADTTFNANIIFEAATGKVEVGERCTIGPTTIICRDHIRIGNDVMLAWGITLYDHDSNSLDWRERSKVIDHFHQHFGRGHCYDMLDWTGVRSAPIVIGDRVWLGFDVVVLKGVTIGEGAIVGARSVVTRDVEPYTVVAGNPARLIRRLPTQSPAA